MPSDPIRETTMTSALVVEAAQRRDAHVARLEAENVRLRGAIREALGRIEGQDSDQKELRRVGQVLHEVLMFSGRGPSVEAAAGTYRVHDGGGVTYTAPGVEILAIQPHAVSDADLMRMVQAHASAPIGWHWWRTPWGANVIRYCYADRDEWSDGLTPEMIAQGWVYLCQALPPEDVPDASRVLSAAGR